MLNFTKEAIKESEKLPLSYLVALSQEVCIEIFPTLEVRKSVPKLYQYSNVQPMYVSASPCTLLVYAESGSVAKRTIVYCSV